MQLFTFLLYSMVLACTALAVSSQRSQHKSDDGLGPEDGETEHSRTKDNELADEDAYFASLGNKRDSGKYSDEARVSYDALLEHESEGEVAGANDLLTVSVADDVSSDEGDTGAVSARRFLDNEQEHESLEVAYDVNEEDEHDVDHAAWLSDKESESEAKDTGNSKIKDEDSNLLLTKIRARLSALEHSIQAHDQ